MSALRHVRIERDRDKPGARVLIDGEDVSNTVSEVSWTLKAGHMPMATIVLAGAEIAADAEILETAEPAAAPSIEVLSLKPGDVLVVRHDKHLSQADMAAIRANMAKLAPGYPVAVLDGGLELAVVRQEVDTGGGVLSPEQQRATDERRRYGRRPD